MKCLRSLGKHQRKKAEVIQVQQEDQLWSMGLLGDHNPQVLLDTLVYYIGLYFAIRGGEHRKLRFRPSQLELVEHSDGNSCLIFTEFVSKTNQGGLLHRKKEPKKVVHHANAEFPELCLIRLFKLYNSRCPKDWPDNAFCLRLLSKPKRDIWYQKSPVGHNLLAKTVSRLFKAAGIVGHYSNHSLRATSATRLFDAGVDEQLIMSRTGHSSAEGVRLYKRITENLREKTSDVLNTRAVKDVKASASSTETSMFKDDTDPVPQCKENADPTSVLSKILFSGATNFTVNLNF